MPKYGEKVNSLMNKKFDSESANGDNDIYIYKDKNKDIWR